MIGDSLRRKTKNSLTKVGEKLSIIHISANMFSSLALVWSALFTIFIITNNKILALVFYLLAVIWDGIDGAFAAKRNDITKFGYYIEGIIDKLAEIIIYLGIFLVGYKLESFLLVSFVVMNSFAKPRAAMVVYIGEFDWPAIGERVERLILLSIGVILYVFNIYNIQVDMMKIDLFQVIIIATTILVFIGMIQRILFAKKLIQNGGIKDLPFKDRLK